MATIEELKREIAKEKAYAESDVEMLNLGKQKKGLEKKLKSMKYKRKFGKFTPNVNTATVRKVSSKIIGGVKRLGSEVNKVRIKQDSIDCKQRTDLKPNNEYQPKQQRRVGLFG